MCAILSLLTLIFISTHLTLGFLIITPSSANGWRNSGPQLLEWQLAGSDPATFAVVLTTVDGSVNRLLAADVDSSRWFTDVNPPSGGWPVGTSFNFRVNFVKDANDLDTVYASSQVFNIEAVVPVDTTTSRASVPYSPTPTSPTVSSTTSYSSAVLTTPSASASWAIPSSSAILTTSSSGTTSATSSSSAILTTPSSSTSATPSSSAILTTSSLGTTSASSSSSAISASSSSSAILTTTTSMPHITSPQYSTSYISALGISTAPMAGSTTSATVSRKVLRTRRTFR